MKKALISGITGMDGSYLADYLLEKGYKVYGLVRRSSQNKYDNIEHIINKIEISEGDIQDQSCLSRIIRSVEPDEIYNLAAQSYVKYSFDAPLYTAEVTGLGALKLFEATRLSYPKAKIYQASSSEMFGSVREVPQKETTPFYPRSPYGCAKAFAHYAAINYRESYNMFISCGIAFNHEGERRGEEFVTRKISKAVAEISFGIRDKLELGNTESRRDWGYAKDYVKAMHLMLDAKNPNDYILATGKQHSVEDFLREAFSVINIKDYENYVVRNSQKNLRPADVPTLVGDISKIGEDLFWTPKTTFKELVSIMVQSDIERLSK